MSSKDHAEATFRDLVERTTLGHETDYWQEVQGSLPSDTRLVDCTSCGLKVAIPDPSAYEIEQWYLLAFPFVSVVHTSMRYDFYCFRLNCQKEFRAQVAHFNRQHHLLRARSPSHSTMEDRRSMVDFTSPTDSDLEKGIRAVINDRLKSRGAQERLKE